MSHNANENRNIAADAQAIAEGAVYTNIEAERAALPPPAEREVLEAEVNKRMSGSLLRLRSRAPFFATLALFARIRVRYDLPTAATDGRDVFWNPYFLQTLTPGEADAVLLHEVLHAALLHVVRRGTREPFLWNIACDIQVNGIIAREAARSTNGNGYANFTLPASAIRDPELETLAVEEIYEILLKQGLKEGWVLEVLDLLNGDGEGGSEGGGISDPAKKRAVLTAHWRAAMSRANALVRMGQGTVPAGMERELAALEPSQLDWRARLWRYMVKTPTDYSGFDRRFVGRGLYLESLDGETVQVWVGIDTSGSIGAEEMGPFLGEVVGILQAYPHIKCGLFYCDAQAYGPYTLSSDSGADFPKPLGGGGTSFVPFFEAVEIARQSDPNGGDTTNTVCIYLTDGYGTFPGTPPPLDVLWIVSPGGLDLNEFPFGETVRLVG